MGGGAATLRGAALDPCQPLDGWIGAHGGRRAPQPCALGLAGPGRAPRSPPKAGSAGPGGAPRVNCSRQGPRGVLIALTGSTTRRLLILMASYSIVV